MASPPAPVGIVVVSWNSARYLPACLDSIAALDPAAAEVVVVDAGSTDGSADLARGRLPAPSVVACGENVGFCRGNNLGIRRTSSPFVLALNPDTRLAPDFLGRLMPAFEDPRVGIAAGKLLRFDGKTLDSAGQMLGRSRQPIDRGYGRPDRGQFDRDAEVFGACGAAALYRRAMIDAIADGPGTFFDERFFAFYEDLDVAWRARKLGWKAVYRHDALAYHARGGTAAGGPGPRRFAALLGRSAEVRFHAVKNRYLSVLRNDRPGAYLRDLPFIAVRDLAVLALLALTSPRVLIRLWAAREAFREALVLRRLDALRPRHHVESGTPG